MISFVLQLIVNCLLKYRKLIINESLDHAVELLNRDKVGSLTLSPFSSVDEVHEAVLAGVVCLAHGALLNDSEVDCNFIGLSHFITVH